MMKSSEVVPDGGAVCGWDDDADASHSITIPIEINSIFIFCVMLVAAKLIPRFLSTVFYTEWIFNEVPVHHVSAYCIWCVSIIRARGQQQESTVPGDWRPVTGNRRFCMRDDVWCQRTPSHPSPFCLRSALWWSIFKPIQGCWLWRLPALPTGISPIAM